MLPSKKRLSSRAFLAVLGKSRAVRSENFSLRYVREKTSSIVGFAVVTPKNVCRSAVNRNRLRRRVYSAVAKIGDLEKAGMKGIFFSQKGADKLTFREIFTQVEGLLRKAG